MNYSRTILIPSTTLTASGGDCIGTADLTNKVGEVTLYIGYLAGTTADTLNVSLRYSPDDTLYFEQMTEVVKTSSIELVEANYTLVDTHGTTENIVLGENIGYIEAVDNDETQIYTSNIQRLKTVLPPATSTTPVIYHNGTAFGTVTEKANPAAFTAPASLAAGTVEWALSTGELNFSSADLISYVGQKITVDYETKYNLFRIPFNVNDNYLKVALSETAASAYGTAFCWIDYSPEYK